jgi:transposase
MNDAERYRQVVPDKFRAIHELRSGTPRYWDLHDVEITIAEKIFLAREALNETTLLHDLRQVSNEDGSVVTKSQREIARRYNLQQSSLSRWVGHYRQGIPLQPDKGRPFSIDTQGMEEIKKSIEGGAYSTRTILKNELHHMLVEKKVDTLQRLGHAVDEPEDVNVDKRVQKRVVKTLGIKFRMAQELTAARLKAKRDCRAFYRVACLFEGFSGHLPPEYKFNADGTTMVVRENNYKALVCYIPQKDELEKLDSSVVNTNLAVLLKWVLFCNAAGQTGPVVIMVTVPDMPDEEYYAHWVVGLAATSDLAASKGRIYFCKTRAGNAAAWKDWFREIVLPMMKICKETYKFRFQDGSEMNIILSTDGEAIVMSQAFDAAIMQEFNALLVDYLKNAPSASSALQPCDRSPVFRDVKTGLRKVTGDDVKTTNRTLSLNIQEAMEQLQQRFSDVKLASRKQKIIHACEKFIYVLQYGYCNPHKLTTGFVVIGMETHIEGSSVDYEKIMRACLTYKDLSEEDKQNLRDHKAEVIAQFRHEGRVTTEFLDSIGVIGTDNSENRDDRVLWQQDCLVVSHKDTVARWNAYLLDKENSGSPTGVTAGAFAFEAIPSSGQPTKAQKRKLNTILAAEQREAAKKAARAEETARKAALTKVQRAQEIAAKKAATAAAKAKREAKLKADRQWAHSFRNAVPEEEEEDIDDADMLLDDGEQCEEDGDEEVENEDEEMDVEN